MIIKIDRAFEKDVKSILNQPLINLLVECIDEIESAESIKEIKNLKKLQGTKF